MSAQLPGSLRQPTDPMGETGGMTPAARSSIVVTLDGLLDDRRGAVVTTMKRSGQPERGIA